MVLGERQPAFSPLAHHPSRGRPDNSTRALGTSQPRREPEPAAVRTAQASLSGGIYLLDNNDHLKLALALIILALMLWVRRLPEA